MKRLQASLATVDSPPTHEHHMEPGVAREEDARGVGEVVARTRAADTIPIDHAKIVRPGSVDLTDAASEEIA